MDFTYSEEQRMLLDSADRLGLERGADRRSPSEVDLAATRRLWSEMAELGWLMLPIPEARGGLGGGLVEVMALQEAMGRHLLATPFVVSCVLVPALLDSGGEDVAALLAAIGAGETMAAAALLEADGGYDLFRVATHAERTSDGFHLSGAKCHVEDGGDADTFIVSARTGGLDGDRDGVSLFVVPADAEGLTVRRYRSIDGHRHARLELHGVSDAKLVGEPGTALPAIEDAVARAGCAWMAEAMGSMEAVTAQTLEYLRTRQQFGRPIGSFQVLQHRIVDMTIACEEARAMTAHATLNRHLGADGWLRAVAAGRARVGETATFVAQQAVQLHGGVGFSDELAVSHHYRRLVTLASIHGSVDHHRGRFAG